MAIHSRLFEWVANALEERTHFTRLQARGTIRIGLRRGGLNAASVTLSDTVLFLEKVLPGELENRGVEDPAELCQALIRELKTVKLSDLRPVRPSPEEIFRRVFGEEEKE